MAKANTSVKWFYTGQQGLGPTATNTPGSLIAFLDKVLVNGFNSLTLDSLSVANDLATATRSLGHGYVKDQVITIAGATPSSLNGEWRIADVTQSTFTFVTEGISDVTATGTITAKVSPIGWEKVFHTGNVAVYRSYETDTPRFFYRIVDSSTDDGTIIVDTCRTMNAYDDISSRLKSSNWHQRPQGGAFVVGDSRTFYVSSYRATYARLQMWTFGAFKSFKPGDVDNAFADYKQASSDAAVWESRSPNYYTYAPSVVSGLGVVQGYGVKMGTTLSGHDMDGSVPNFPSPVDQGFLMADHLIREYGHSGDPIRGIVRGSYWVIAKNFFPALSSTFEQAFTGLTIEGVSGLPGRKFRVLGLHSPVNGTLIGRALFDITGPWDY